MALFRKNEERELNEQSLDQSLRAALGSTAVSAANIGEIPAVETAINWLAGTIASLPIRLYRTVGEESTEVLDDYRLHLLNAETGDLLDADQWKRALVRDYLVSGNGYTVVDWAGNEIQGLYYVEPIHVAYETETDPIYKAGRILIGGSIIPHYRVLRVLRKSVDGLHGLGLVEENQLQLSLMLNTMKYENRMVRTGAKKGFLKVMPGAKLAQGALDNLKKAWNKIYGIDSEENTVLLNAGVEFQDAGQTAVESQLNENKATNDRAVYKLLGIVPSVIEGGASVDDLKNTVRFGVRPIVQVLQAAINRFCLLEEEKGTLAFEIDMDALESADILARYQAYEIAVRNGWMQLDEVRNEEGKNPLGLDFVRLGLDTVIYDPKSKQIYTPNTKEWAGLRENGGEGNANRDPSKQGVDERPGLRERDGQGQQNPAG